MKNQNNETPAITERYIEQLQDELAAATERSRLAKRAVKEAKAEAKIAKRDKKLARKALVAAQSALDEKTAPTASERADSELTEATHQRIPDSPEVNRTRRRRKPKADTAATIETTAAAELPDPAPGAPVK